MALLSVLLGAGSGGRRKSYLLDYSNISYNTTTANQAFVADADSHVRIVLNTSLKFNAITTIAYFNVYIDDVLYQRLNLSDWMSAAGQKYVSKEVESSLEVTAGSHNLKIYFGSNTATDQAQSVRANIVLIEQPLS